MGTQLNNIPNGSLQKEIIINNNFKALANNAFLSINQNNTNGLNLYYFGGTYIDNNGDFFNLNDGFITLTINNTFYVEFNTVNNTVEFNTVEFTINKIPIAIVITDNTRIISIDQVKINKILKKGESNDNVIGLPIGGNIGQVLAKNSENDYDVEWIDQSSGSGNLPVGGTTGQVLAKVDNSDYNVQWVDQSSGSGTSNKVLKFLTNDLNISSNLDSVINDWTFTLPPKKTCKIKFNLLYRTQIATDGARAGFFIQSGNSSINLIGNTFLHASISGNPTATAVQDGDAINIISNLSIYSAILSTGSTLNLDTPIYGEATFINRDTIASHQISIYAASKINASVITLKIGSSVEFELI